MVRSDHPSNTKRAGVCIPLRGNSPLGGNSPLRENSVCIKFISSEQIGIF